MATVYMLEHEYTKPDGAREVKGLGIYSSREKVERRLQTAKTLKGFRDYPDKFIIREIAIDEDLWEKGLDLLR